MINKHDDTCENAKDFSVGGQALIEGLLMINGLNVAIAIRKPDGEIIVDKKVLPKKTTNIPIIRGAVALIKQMIIGVKALIFSSEFIEIEEDTEIKPSKFEQFIEKIFGDKVKDVVIYIAVAISLIFSIGFFILLPNFLAGLLNFNKEIASGLFYYNFIEGIVRVILFLSYIILVSKFSKDMKRVWQYHGAEHKTIHCYENKEELTVENIKKYSTRHPRCGTSFLFTIMIISILVFSFTGWHNVLINAGIRIMLIPIVAGISYEIFKFAAKSKFKIISIINIPGLIFQKYTTSEPDDSQIEVAIAALNGALSK